MFSLPNRKQNNNCVTTEQCWAKAPFIKFKNPLNTNLYKNTNIPCNSTIKDTKRQKNSLFNLVMLIPVSCTGYIIGKKGQKIKTISKNCQVHININTKFILQPHKEFRTTISGKIMNCKKAMKQILQLIRQVNFFKKYPLKVQVDNCYLPHIIGRKGKFLKNIKIASKADFVKIFSSGPHTKSNGLLFIKDNKIKTCMKAANIVISKVWAMKTFQIRKYQTNGKLLLPNKKISQTFDCKNNTIIHNTQEPVIERPPSLHINTINVTEVKKPAEIKNIALNKQIIVENTTENSAVEPVNQCSKLELNEVTCNKNTNKTASLSKLGDFMNIMSSHVLQANLTKKIVHQIFKSVFFEIPSTF